MNTTAIIPHQQLGGLLFGQQHVLTQAFFVQQLGEYHTISLDDTPHYRFLAEHLCDPFSSHIYSDYLTCSWDYYRRETNTPESRRERIKAYVRLYHEIEARQTLGADAIEKPITICQRPDGRIVIVDGNHRAAIALKLKLDVRASVLPLENVLNEIVAVPDEFYGTRRLSMPYQSVVYRGRELIRGRRTDVQDRFEKIDPADLRGKAVLDLGCNLGLNCYLAAEHGATLAVGVELSPKIASAAVRLNAYFASPCFFLSHDLNQELDFLPRFDTVFCFSLIDHVAAKENLVRTIMATAANVVYFEGHAETNRSTYENLLNGEHFSRIDHLGFGHDGIGKETRTRPLFRCEVRSRGTEPLVMQDPRDLFRDGYARWFRPAATRTWADQIHAVVQQVEAIVPTGERFILVDDCNLPPDSFLRHRAMPFLERNGQYWGPPADDATAIDELSRQQGRANYIVFAWPSFWWLDHYAGFAAHLRRSTTVLHADERLVVFRLSREATAVGPAHESLPSAHC